VSALTTRSKIPFPVKVPFVERLGLELHSCAHGASEVRVDLTDAHMNSWEVAHGGVLMTLLDVAMAMAARSQHPGRAGGGDHRDEDQLHAPR
jgi:acyl-coenzyme A thioesterase PaaI-like protein